MSQMGRWGASLPTRAAARASYGRGALAGAMPVDFEPSEEGRAIVKGVLEFAERHAMPLSKKYPGMLKDERAYLREDGRVKDEIVADVQALKRKSAEAGYYAMGMPEALGGAGRPMVDVALAMSALCETGDHFATQVLASVEGPSPMLTHCSQEQQARWVRPLVRAEKSTAFCITEPGAGSDLNRLSMRAERKNGTYKLNGTKTYITNGPYADFYEVFARTSGETGLDGITLFLVDRDEPGVEVGGVQQTIVADGLQSEVHFRDVELTEENRVGEEGAGFLYAISNIGYTRVLIGAMCLGYAKYCLDQAVAYARGREAFGRPIGKLQGVSFPLADVATRIYATENMLLNTAWKIDRGDEVIQESSMVKVYATETFFEAADVAVQVHGGAGVMRELPLEQLFRLARMLRIPEGTSEVQRATIAKTLGL